MESKFLVLQKMIWNKRKYYPYPHRDCIVILPAWAAEQFYYAGVITDDLKCVNGKIVHPLDRRYSNNEKA